MIKTLMIFTSIASQQKVSEILEKNQNIDESHIPALAELLSKAVTDKNYFVISGVALMFTVFLMRKFLLPKVLTDEKLKIYTPMISVIISLLVGIASWLLNPKLNIFEIILTSISTVVVASGSWEMIKPVSKMEILSKIMNKSKALSDSKIVIENNQEEKKE